MEQRAKLLFEIFDSVFVGIFWGSTQNFASHIERIQANSLTSMPQSNCQKTNGSLMTPGGMKVN